MPRMIRAVAVPAAVALALLSIAVAHQQPSGAPQTIVKHFTPADRVSGRYQYVPFDVPVGATTLRVSYDYDRSNGENVVDLGVFEPGSLDLGTRAFRGYSGGAKSSFEISPYDATPGYRRGPIPSGTWNLLLGLYKVRDAGVQVTVTVAVESTGDKGRRDIERLQAGGSSSAARWYVGALHTHTLHSDGTMEPSALLRQFGNAGFDFVALTDHNNTTHGDDPRLWGRTTSGPLWIIGEEVTTPAGHASVWGLRPGDWIDFRVTKGDLHIRDLVNAAHDRGALFSINHPVSECVGCGWEHEISDAVDGIEISNGRHGELEKAVKIWDTLLRSGRRITAVGSSDWHSAPTPIDDAHVRVYAAALDQQGILDGIRRGRVILMRDARAETPDVIVRAGHNTARIGDSLDVTGASWPAWRAAGARCRRSRSCHAEQCGRIPAFRDL
jgi:hypothetical protein